MKSLLIIIICSFPAHLRGQRMQPSEKNVRVQLPSIPAIRPILRTTTITLKDTTVYHITYPDMGVLGNVRVPDFSNFRRRDLDMKALAARNTLKQMGCKEVGGEMHSYFCTTGPQWDSAVRFLRLGYINDVKGELFSQPTVPIESVEVPNAPVLSVTGTPVIVIQKNNQTDFKLTGKSVVKLRFDIPVLGPAPTCTPNFPILTKKQYNRELADQQNYIVESRHYGLWSFQASNSDGYVIFTAVPCDVDMLVAYNHAAKNNLWGKDFYINMEFKAGALFMMHNPVCSYKNGTYSFEETPKLILKYKKVKLPVKVIAQN